MSEPTILLVNLR